MRREVAGDGGREWCLASSSRDVDEEDREDGLGPGDVPRPWKESWDGRGASLGLS